MSTPRGTPGHLGPKWSTPYWFERRRHSIANCGWMVTDIAQRQWRAYRKPPYRSRMLPSLTTYDRPFPQNGGSICPKIREWPYLRNGWSDTLHVWFRVGGRRIEWGYFWLHQIQVGGRPPSWIISNGHISATAHSMHLYSAHRPVIFVIAQLPCLHHAARAYRFDLSGRYNDYVNILVRYSTMFVNKL